MLANDGWVGVGLQESLRSPAANQHQNLLIFVFHGLRLILRRGIRHSRSEVVSSTQFDGIPNKKIDRIECKQNPDPWSANP